MDSFGCLRTGVVVQTSARNAFISRHVITSLPLFLLASARLFYPFLLPPPPPSPTRSPLRISSFVRGRRRTLTDFCLLGRVTRFRQYHNEADVDRINSSRALRARSPGNLIFYYQPDVLPWKVLALLRHESNTAKIIA